MAPAMMMRLGVLYPASRLRVRVITASSVSVAPGQGQQPLGGAGIDAFGGAAAVASEVELALEGVVDRLDPLIERECGCGRRTKSPAPEGQSRFSMGRGSPRSSFLRRVIGDRRLWPADSAPRYQRMLAAGNVG